MRSDYRLHGQSAADLTAAPSRKSSFSAAGGKSADLARTQGRRIGAPGARNEEGTALFFTRAEWEAFMSGAQRGEPDSD